MSSPLRLAGLAGAAFVAQLGVTGLNVALPSLARAFGAPPGQVGAVVVAYLVTTTAGLLIVGPLGDRVGRRRVLLAGIAIFVAAAAWGAAAPNLPALVAARALQGFGGAAMAAMSIALVIDAFPPERTGATLGALGTTSALATMLGPSLGGVIVATLGWRWLLGVNIPLGIAAASLVACTLADTRTTARSAALVDGALLRNPRLLAGLATSVLVSGVMITTLIVGPFVLSGMGLKAAAIGLVMAAGPLVSVILAVPAGRLADRIGARTTTVWALGCFTVGSALIAAVVDRHSVVAYTFAIVVLSVGYAMFQTPNSAAVMAEAPPDRRATVSGLLSLARNVGFIGGAAALGAVFTAGGAIVVFVATTLLGAIALTIVSLPAARVPART